MARLARSGSPTTSPASCRAPRRSNARSLATTSFNTCKCSRERYASTRILWSLKGGEDESQIELQRPLRHHHGRKARRAVLACQPGKGDQTAHHLAGQAVVSSGGGGLRVATGAAHEP